MAECLKNRHFKISCIITFKNKLKLRCGICSKICPLFGSPVSKITLEKGPPSLPSSAENLLRRCYMPAAAVSTQKSSVANSHLREQNCYISSNYFGFSVRKVSKSPTNYQALIGARHYFPHG